MISYIIPTRNRPERLRRTLLALESLGDHHQCGGAEVIVVDNDSDERLIVARELRSGLPLHYIRLKENLGAAARNIGSRHSDASSNWLVMLDDDSYPDDLDFLSLLNDVPSDVVALSADIFLPPAEPAQPAPREMGGLPEVFIGCGVAIRREAFLDLGGYDKSFGYYVEEYDLAARIIRDGGRICFEPLFTVQHDKDLANRDFEFILSRLVRNNGWLVQRYAPDADLKRERAGVLRRYREIGRQEGALDGFARGLSELRATIRKQRRDPLPRALWDRFVGLAAVREHLQAAYRTQPFTTATLIDEGKNAWAVRYALAEMGVRILADDEEAEAHIIATLSPGPMLDALNRRQRLRRPHGPRLLAPWAVRPRPAELKHSAA